MEGSEGVRSRRHPRGVGRLGGGGGENGVAGRPRTAVGAQCAGGCQEVYPPGSAEAGGRQGRARAARGGSGEERRQQRKRRRERADGRGGKRAGGDVGGWARKGTPGREGGEMEWMGATVAAGPTLVQAVAAGVAPTGQCGGEGGRGEGGTRRWRTWSTSAVAASPWSRDRSPSTGWRWSRGGGGMLRGAG